MTSFQATGDGPCPAGYYPPPNIGDHTLFYAHQGYWCLNNDAYFHGIAAAGALALHAVFLGTLLAAAIALSFHLGPRRKWAITGTLALAGLAVMHPAIFAVAAAVTVAAGGAAWWLFHRRFTSIPATSGRKED